MTSSPNSALFTAIFFECGFFSDLNRTTTIIERGAISYGIMKVRYVSIGKGNVLSILVGSFSISLIQI